MDEPQLTVEQELDLAVDRDAKEFGLHVRQGGWRLGLLVARNVEKGKGASPGDNQHTTRSFAHTKDLGKVSAAEFARRSDTSADRILRYLTAWDKAAEAGHVPPASGLSPGDEGVALDVEALPDWTEFYPPQYQARMDRGVRATLRDKPETVVEAIGQAIKDRPELAKTLAPQIAKALEEPEVAEAVARASTPKARRQMQDAQRERVREEAEDVDTYVPSDDSHQVTTFQDLLRKLKAKDLPARIMEDSHSVLNDLEEVDQFRSDYGHEVFDDDGVERTVNEFLDGVLEDFDGRLEIAFAAAKGAPDTPSGV
jgi:hypothetical protein